MALSDLEVFSETAYIVSQELLAQQIELFNDATSGTITLAADPIRGDYRTEAQWARIGGLIRRRNPYGSGAVTAKDLSMVTDVFVKVAAGTPPINIPPSMFRWIQQNPSEGGAQIGRQLATDTLADMLNTALMAGTAAMTNDAENTLDITALSSPANTMTHPVFNNAQALFGDAYQDILCWVMHSKPLFDIYRDAMANSAFLFNFGTVTVKQDAWGRRFIISDSPSLVSLHDSLQSGQWAVLHPPQDLDEGTIPSPGNPAYVYASLGLTSGAINVRTQGDFDDNTATLNGTENIQRTYQAEWSYALNVKGYRWDTTNGSHAPNDAALATATNWDRYLESNKHLAGVLVRSH